MYYFERDNDIMKANENILDFIAKENVGMPELIKLMFSGYLEKKQKNELYSSDDYIPQNLIKIYYGTCANRSFDDIASNFKKRYICNENEIEGVHHKLEMEGLEVVYDFIQQQGAENFKNIYVVMYLHQLLYSKMPYDGYGGKFRNQSAMISNSDVKTSEPSIISSDISKLNNDYLNLIKIGDEINKNREFEGIIDYIDKCLMLKTRIIEIHPFPDGNGRVCRALLNILLKRVDLPPTYVTVKEKAEYIAAMDKAVRLNDPSAIRKFYYYKICDSIVELDLNDRLEKTK